jgi:hypothetical protein
MIIAHHNPGQPAIATIHLVPAHEWDRMADRAMLILRSLCGNGVEYRIMGMGRERIGYT